MFERFTNDARRVVIVAKEEAEALNHDHIGSEHLLLALLDESSGRAFAILRNAGVTRPGTLTDIQRLNADNDDTLGEADAAALQEIGIDLAAIRSKLEEAFGPGALDSGKNEQEPGHWRWLPRSLRGGAGNPRFTAHAKVVLELSLREAMNLKDRHIGSEHILLGMLREQGSLAARVLSDSGVALSDLRAQTLAVLRRPGDGHGGVME